MYITYFGLCFIGLAAFFYKLRCPQELKKSDDITHYIEIEKQNLTKPRITILVTKIASFYRENSTKNGEEASFKSGVIFDQEIEDMSYQTVKVIAERVAEDIPELYNVPADEDELHYFTHRSYINMENWMDTIESPRQVVRAVADRFYEHALSHSTDILTLFYMSADRYAPMARGFIFSLYLLGFSLLSIPTMFTFISIIISLRS